MTSEDAGKNSAPVAQPQLSNLYVPKGSFDSHKRMVWNVMRLSSSREDAIWCTVCKTWFKYKANSMPSLIRHCARFHYYDNGLWRSKPTNRHPRSGSSPFAASTKPVSRVAATNGRRGSSTVGVSPKAIGPKESGNLPAISTVATTRRHTMQVSTSTAAPPTPSGRVSTSPAVTTRNLPTKRRSSERMFKVIATPDAVKRVAVSCQSLLFQSTGMTFFNVKFQVPSSKDEALSVINEGIRDPAKGDTSKTFLLAWAHSQFFSSEMAALGYRFITAGIRRDEKMTHPPPVEEWLTLQLPLLGQSMRKAKVPRPSMPKIPNIEPVLWTSKIPAPHASSEKGQGHKQAIEAVSTAHKKLVNGVRKKIVETIDLT